MIAYNGQTLAYLGDAVFELLIRKFLLTKGLTKVGKLHNQAVYYTSAEGQKRALDKIENTLNEEEWAVVKRGRNAQLTRKSRSTDLKTYQYATGLEALLGYLYLEGNTDRIEVLFDEMTNDYMGE